MLVVLTELAQFSRIYFINTSLQLFHSFSQNLILRSFPFKNNFFYIFQPTATDVNADSAIVPEPNGHSSAL